MKKWIKTLAIGCIVALGAAACDDAGTEPDPIDDAALRANVALVAADGVFQDHGQMVTVIGKANLSNTTFELQPPKIFRVTKRTKLKLMPRVSSQHAAVRTETELRGRVRVRGKLDQSCVPRQDSECCLPAIFG